MAKKSKRYNEEHDEPDEPEDIAEVSVTSKGKAESRTEGQAEGRTGQMEPPVLPPEAVVPPGYEDALVSTQWEMARGAETLKLNNPDPPDPEVPASTDIIDISIANPAVVTVADGSVLVGATGIVISGTSDVLFDKSFAAAEYTLAANTITLTAVDNSLGATHTGLVTCAV